MENNNYLITTSVAPHFDKSKVGSGDSRAYKKLNDDKFYIAVICTVIQKMYLYFPKLACIDEIGEIIISQQFPCSKHHCTHCKIYNIRFALFCVLSRKWML